MKVDMKGRVAVITGGSGGIGSGMCRIFAENGAFVYICDINDEPGYALEKEITAAGGKAKYVHCDIMKDEDCEAVVREAASCFGRVDYLINNAGTNIPINKRGKIADYDEEGWSFTIDVCMDGMYHLNRHVIPVMKAQKSGRIINVGSVTGFRMGLRDQCAYNMSKAAIHNITRELAIEYAESGITVNGLLPGTTWHERFYKKHEVNDEMKAKFLSHVPLAKPNSPEDMAYGALYLCSSEAERVTGVLLNVDSGWAAGYCRG